MAREKLAEANIINNALRYTVRNIDQDKNFWMIRTKKGFFWRVYSGQICCIGVEYYYSKTDFGKKQEEILKESIKNWYGDLRPAGAINKCKSFIFDIQEGIIF